MSTAFVSKLQTLVFRWRRWWSWLARLRFFLRLWQVVKLEAIVPLYLVHTGVVLVFPLKVHGVVCPIAVARATLPVHIQWMIRTFDRLPTVALVCSRSPRTECFIVFAPCAEVYKLTK